MADQLTADETEALARVTRLVLQFKDRVVERHAPTLNQYYTTMSEPDRDAVAVANMTAGQLLPLNLMSQAVGAGHSPAIVKSVLEAMNLSSQVFQGAVSAPELAACLPEELRDPAAIAILHRHEARILAAICESSLS